MAKTAKQLAPDLPGLIWRLAVYFAILIGAFQLLAIVYRRAFHALNVHFSRTPDARPAESVGIGEAILLVAAVLAWRITARLGRDRLNPILPCRSTAAPHLVQGILWGFLGIGTTIGAIASLGGYRVSGLALSGAALAYYLPLWLLVAAINALAENLAVLGYPLSRSVQVIGWPRAVILVGAIFAAAHLGNPGENPVGIVSLFMIGVLLATTVWLTGDLWLSLGIHVGAIIGEDLVFSVPDSGVTYTGGLLVSRMNGPAWLTGGDAGPEGSALALPIFIFILAVLWRIYRQRPIIAEGQ